MKKQISFLIFICTMHLTFGQVEDAWVYFADKPNAASYLSAPLTMLTQRALDRRTAQSIALSVKDVPLEATYVAAVATSTGIEIKARSKWLNALHVRGTKVNIDALLQINGVASVTYGNSTLNKEYPDKTKKRNKEAQMKEVSNFDYGVSTNQIQMLNGDFLHNLGYKGEGMHIAVLDAGFQGVESFVAFAYLHDSETTNGEIIGGYDFVNRNANFYANTGSTHGLSVLSTMGAQLPGQFIGTAPNAQFYLFVTEDPPNENPLEESLWVEAAERADSLGVDIINTSLGYTTFDNSSYNYTYADMDGNTTFISRGAELAAATGMLLVTSAGNSGSDAWHYISAPADAPSVLSVGAVNAQETIAVFSSFGPTSDNRVKPEVLAQGQNVYVINAFGNIATSNGTSFSSPIMAGMAACLWQAFPDKPAHEIRQLIVESSDLYNNPTDQYGYGIPDFQSICELLSVPALEASTIRVYPNPVTTTVYFEGLPGMAVPVVLSDPTGSEVLNTALYKGQSTLDVSFLEPGLYFINALVNGHQVGVKLIKK